MMNKLYFTLSECNSLDANHNDVFNKLKHYIAKTTDSLVHKAINKALDTDKWDIKDLKGRLHIINMSDGAYILYLDDIKILTIISEAKSVDFIMSGTISYTFHEGSG